ncbi:MAG: GTPase HflX [Lachnospiraceae bacterium]|nr:GTPase HflX [Lachnospiraceae bacterium]
MQEILLEETVNVILVGVNLVEREEDFDRSMKELKSLAEACGKKTVGIVTQNMESVNQGFYVGTGKVKEIKELAVMMEAQEVIFDDALSPSQMRNLGKEIDLPILDRTNLILDIFALRAKSREAKLQVESARLQYMLPRLIGMREQLGRQGGASGSLSNKGAGETKLELDRRRIEHRISELRKELTEIESSRETMRKRRDDSHLPQVALIGYTNAGKSTIMNRMLGRYGAKKEKTVLEMNMLFATLDTTVRSMEFPDHRSFLLSDTVGFIHKLPTDLVKAFRSTLDEVKYADLLLHVVDYSDENHKKHMEVTQKTLREIGAGAIPQIIVYNKADLVGLSDLPRIVDNKIFMAAAPEVGIAELAELVRNTLYAGNEECTFLFPYEKGGEASRLMEIANVASTEYLPEGIRIKASCTKREVMRYSEFATIQSHARK